jgi:hypothetical protein
LTTFLLSGLNSVLLLMSAHAKDLLPLALAAVLAGAGPLARQPDRADAPRSFRSPGRASPGRPEVTFSSGGDIWSVSRRRARLLVADAANDRRPLFSPDGRHRLRVHAHGRR